MALKSFDLRKKMKGKSYWKMDIHRKNGRYSMRSSGETFSHGLFDLHDEVVSIFPCHLVKAHIGLTFEVINNASAVKY